MNIKITAPEGLYIVAVSGGVDSVTLLDLLANKPNTELIVAHLDHGIRADSDNDRLLVQGLAKKYGLRFVYKRANLGPQASEEISREVRYDFLDKTRKKYKAKGIITAHHQDDVIETAIINLMRGTGRRGISSLQSHDDLVRPLLEVPKKTLREYAKKHSLVWHEDSTNTDPSYLRNYVRLKLLPKFSTENRERLLNLINRTGEFNKQADKELTKQLVQHLSSDELDRQWFIMLPHSIAKEVMATWFRKQGLTAYDRKTLDRAVIASKTFRANTQVNIYNDYSLVVKKKYLALTTIDR